MFLSPALQVRDPRLGEDESRLTPDSLGREQGAAIPSGSRIALLTRHSFPETTSFKKNHFVSGDYSWKNKRHIEFWKKEGKTFIIAIKSFRILILAHLFAGIISN